MASSSPSTEFPITIVELQALASGIPKYCPNVVLMLAGKQYTAPDAAAFVQSFIDPFTAVQTAEASLKNARTALAAAIATNGAAVKTLRSTIAGMFSGDAAILAALDIAPKKPRAPLSTAARAAASAKAEATRKARGTTSKKQKATVTGNVTGVTITPIAAPGTSGSSSSASAATGTTTGPVVAPASPVPSPSGASTATGGNGAAAVPVTPGR
jgi:hypothetical protein